MAYEMRELQGSLFFNDRKQKPNQPDYQGSALVEGKKYRLAGWVKSTSAGSRFLSLKLTLEEAKQETAARQDDFLKPAGEKEPAAAKPEPAEGAPPDPEFDDRVPF